MSRHKKPRSADKNSRQWVTLAAVARELEAQPNRLAEFLRDKRVQPAREGSILLGAGDSYAAAVSAAHLSSLRLVAIDPLAVIALRDACRKRDVYFISVSGSTRSNIEAMRAVKGRARRTVAVTCNPSSDLARLADEVVELPFVPAEKSPGITSFSLSLLAALRLGSPAVSCEFHRGLLLARPLSSFFKLAEDGTTYMLGNGPFYGAAIYAAAKIYEFLGEKAHPELLEEFSHMALFSLNRSDAVNLFQGVEEKVSSRLFRALQERSFPTSIIRARGQNAVERLFVLVFASQLAALRAAESRGLRNPFFVTAKDRLSVSDAVIY